MKLPLFIFSILVTAAGCSTTQESNVSSSLFTDSFGVQTYSFRNYFPNDMIGTLDKIQSIAIPYLKRLK